MAEKTLNVTLLTKSDTEANFMITNPVLAQGEMAISTDKGNKFKVGDGVNAWLDLSYNTASADSMPWTSITGKPTAFNPTTHTHVNTDVTGLDNLLTGTQGYLFMSNGSSAPSWTNIIDCGRETVSE
jgi:hypothetical protein